MSGPYRTLPETTDSRKVRIGSGYLSPPPAKPHRCQPPGDLQFQSIHYVSLFWWRFRKHVPWDDGQEWTCDCGKVHRFTHNTIKGNWWVPQ